MSRLDRPQAIELFHVAFLDVLATKVRPDRYILKGGVNLRYFFGSLRYSEDMDLDVRGVERWRLEEQVDAVLGSPQLELVLRASGLAVAGVSKPKQTETTQRWKVAIEAPGAAELVRTKVEFSRRNGETRYRLDTIPAEVVRPYGLRAPSVQHYLDDAAIEQKIAALAKRAQVQARDVFDLDLLLRARPAPLESLEPGLLADAIEQASRVSFAKYRDQVLPFLEPDALVLYEDRASWEQLKVHVVERLREAL